MNSKTPRRIECLSCNASAKCWFNNAIFSPNGRYYLSECLGIIYLEITMNILKQITFNIILGPEIPSVHLISVDDNKFIETLDNNSNLQKIFETTSLPKIRYLTIPGLNIRVELILPETLDEDEDTKYPAVIEM